MDAADPAPEAAAAAQAAAEAGRHSQLPEEMRPQDMSTYTEAVVLAAAALKRGEDANWELARLTYENTLHRNECKENKVEMAQWCSDIRETSGRKFSLGSGRLYKRVWAAHREHADDDRPSWAEAYDSVQSTTAPERFEKANARQITEMASPETKVEVARKLLAEPDVAERVIEDHSARRMVREATDRRAERIEREAHQREEANPTQRQIREATLALDIQNNISSARWHLAEAARKLMDLADRDDEITSTVNTLAGEAEEALGWLRTVNQGGRVTDDDLARLLESGQP